MTQTLLSDCWVNEKRTSNHESKSCQLVIESMTFENPLFREGQIEEVVLTQEPENLEGDEIGALQVNASLVIVDPDPSGHTIGPPTVGQGAFSPTPADKSPEVREAEVLTMAEASKSIEVQLPLSPQPVCKLCDTKVTTITSLVKHYKVRHAKVIVIYKCRKCERSNHKPHSISCHVPKCRGRNEIQSEGLEFMCELCGEGFKTVMGRTQHLRHKHPAKRNNDKILQCKNKDSSREAKVKGTKLWSLEESESLVELARKYANLRNINKLIAEELGSGKSHIQVASKRRQLQREIEGSGPDLEAVMALEEVESPPHLLSSPITPPERTSMAKVMIKEALEEGAKRGGNEIRATVDFVRSVDQNPELIESSALDLIQRLGKGDRLNRKSADRERVSHQKSRGWERKRSHSKKIYRELQRLYSRDQKQLAALVLDGAASKECAIPISEVDIAFRDRWENTRPFQGLGGFRSVALADNSEFYSPISANEVRENLARVNLSSAPGPEGISKQALLDWDPGGEQLACLFTAWMVQGVIPKAFKECRTRLIPKSTNAEELGDTNNWRPITIGSLVLRLFSRILTIRLARACPINPRQRGFISSPGCSENLMILQGIIGNSKAENKPLGVVFIDLAKAFDSISHEHISCALEMRQLDRHVSGLIKNSYVDCVTRVGSGGVMTLPIHMNVGVKQGDPMSPLLFNLAMDPLIQALEDGNNGYGWEGRSITTLAFADDLVLLSSSWKGMRRNLTILENFCQLTGLRVQPRKCHGFYIEKGVDHGTFVINNCQAWEVGGAPLHLVGPGETVRYLGVDVGPERGIVAPDPIEQLQEWIVKITKAPLKPSQKVKVLNSLALPRLIYQADHCNMPETTLTTLDGMIRKAVKSWLHLAPSTCDGLIYCRNRDGGLGVIRMSRMIPTIQAQRILRTSKSNDHWSRLATGKSLARSEWQRLWQRAGGDPAEAPGLEARIETSEASPQHVRRRPPGLGDWRQDEILAWMGLQVQGVGVSEFRGDRISNSWLAEPTSVGFRQRHFIAGLKLRSNTYPTREFLARGRNKDGAACRRCSARLESCSHILGQCPYVQGSRVRRHHKICDLLAIEAERAGWKAIREFRLQTTDGGLKIPDLVCTKAGVALVLDVTVRFELAPDTLELAAKEKVNYYRPFADQIATSVGAGVVKVMGFPVGARGKWPTCNNKVLSEFGLSRYRQKSFAKLVSRRTLLYSLDMLRDFMYEPV